MRRYHRRALPPSHGVLPAVTSSPPSALLADKAALRAQAIAARDALAPEARAAKSQAIADLVDHQLLAGLPPGAVIGVFSSKGAEIDTAPIVARAAARGLRLAYPRVDKPHRELAFHRAEAADLVAGGFGLREPPPGAPRVRPDELAMIFVPGLAFDRAGHRLGWGKGYYDATLSTARSVPAIGLAFSCQLLASVPQTPSDVTVHLVVTEDGIVHAP